MKKLYEAYFAQRDVYYTIGYTKAQTDSFLLTYCESLETALEHKTKGLTSL